MLKERKDFLELNYCRDVVSEHFKNMTSKTEPDWLFVLLNNGVLRQDPNPNKDNNLNDEEVIRFSFQRFQDFLIAEQGLKGIKSGKALFGKKGPFGFVIADGDIAWEWSGLMSALSIILPEKLKIELPDTISKKLSSDKVFSWGYILNEGFKESLRWRSADAFSDRTLELLNSWLDKDDAHAILVQVSVSAEHPYNAEFLSHNLFKRNMPDRDAFWTKWVNSNGDEYSEIYTLIDWSLSDQVRKANQENQKLAALVLCWLLASSNRKIRDKATKALANLLLANSDIFLNLLERFAKIDDLYILENLLAAGYASCCLDPEKDRLEKYSEAVFNKLFINRSPPCGLLLRDYGLGIIELAKYHNCLPSSVNFNFCTPPYKSPKPSFSVTEKQVEKIAEKAGGKSIMYSCLDGDFGIYKIESAIRNFSDITLNKKPPASFSWTYANPLSKSVRCWIAKKAYDYGWTKERFGEEDFRYHGRMRHSIERIGKKYQWLALGEVLSGMADNYWMKSEYGYYGNYSPKEYQTPLDIGFIRNIDPTILTNKPDKNEILDNETWMFDPIIRLDEVEEENLLEWPFKEDPALVLGQLPFRCDENGQEWLVLYEFQLVRQNYLNERGLSSNLRMEQFRFFLNLLVKKKDVNNIAQHFESKNCIDIHRWLPSENIDAGYLLEFPWRKTWETEKYLPDNYLLEDDAPFAELAFEYIWERNLDQSLEEGYSTYLPAAWLARELGLKPDIEKKGVWLDNNGEIIFQENRLSGGIKQIALLRKDAADKIVGKDDIFFGLMVAERTVWPSAMKHKVWDRSEGVCWPSGRGIEKRNWKRDQESNKKKKCLFKAIPALKSFFA